MAQADQAERVASVSPWTSEANASMEDRQGWRCRNGWLRKGKGRGS